MMTFKEFKNEVIRLLKQNIKDDEYITALEDDMKKGYEEQKKVGEILGYNKINPNKYVLGILFMYPELP